MWIAAKNFQQKGAVLHVRYWISGADNLDSFTLPISYVCMYLILNLLQCKSMLDVDLIRLSDSRHHIQPVYMYVLRTDSTIQYHTYVATLFPTRGLYFKA